jgi:hypothetical protein
MLSAYTVPLPDGFLSIIANFLRSFLFPPVEIAVEVR